MKAAIDRIEGGIAILIPCGNETLRLQVPVPELPPGCREGDIITVTLERDLPATEVAKGRVRDLIGRLKK